MPSTNTWYFKHILIASYGPGLSTWDDDNESGKKAIGWAELPFIALNLVPLVTGMFVSSLSLAQDATCGFRIDT